jgi:protein-L-isoaspartate O-methyltransferase
MPREHRAAAPLRSRGHSDDERGAMPPRDYSWRIDTRLDPAVLRDILDLYRPFRNEVHFSSGFSTGEFGDQVIYANPEPLAKLHGFEDHIAIDERMRVLDIGCNLGYYSHYFLGRGVHSAVGVEFDSRLFGCATLLRTVAGLSERTYKLIHGDFGEAITQAAVARHAPFDLILYLGAVNNIRSLTAALLVLPRLLRPGGMVVIEYLAIATADPICRFHAEGFRGDDSHFLSFSEAFLDAFLVAVGITKVARTIEWENPAVLGDYKKIMTIYRRADA